MSLVCRNLHRNRAKLAVVSLKVALQQCDHLLGIAHIVQNIISTAIVLSSKRAMWPLNPSAILICIMPPI